MNMTTNKQALDAQARRMRNYLNTAVISGVKLLHLTTDELSGLLDELEAAERRNAELEAREVKIPELKMLSDYLREVTLREREDIILGVKLEFHRNLKAAGITVKGE